MAGHNVSAVREAAVCLALFGIVLTFISIVGTEWAVPESKGTGEGSETFEGVGLWRYCYREYDTPGGDKYVYACEELVGTSDIPGWMQGVQAVILLATIFYAVAFVTIITFTCCGSRRHDKRLIIGFIVMQTLAGIFNLTGVVLFSEELESSFRDRLGQMRLAWCFIISCVAVALAAASVVVAAVEFFTFKPTVPMQRFVNEMTTQPTDSTNSRDTPNPSNGDAQCQSSDPPDGNTSYQNSAPPEVIPEYMYDQPIPTVEVHKDSSDSNA